MKHYLSLLLILTFFWIPSFKAKEEEEIPPGPNLTSLFPRGGQQGTTFSINLRGTNLDGAYAVWFGPETQTFSRQNTPGEDAQNKISKNNSGLQSHVQAVSATTGVTIQIAVDPEAKVGKHNFALLTPKGLSNTISLRVNSDPIIIESSSDEVPHSKQGEAQPVYYPAVVSGQISEEGEVDYYSFEVSSGDELMFELEAGFDSTLILYKQSGSWFDSERLIRLVYSDDPPRLVHRFSEPGCFIIAAGSFLGLNRSAPSYQLRIVPVASSSSTEDFTSAYHVHNGSFKREISRKRMEELWARTIKPEDAELKELGGSESIPVIQEQEGDANDTPELAIEIPFPSFFEGAIEHPGDVDYFKLVLDTSQSMGIELQTPEREPYLFNPWLRVFDSDGRKLMTNLYKLTGGDGDDWIHYMQSKVFYKFDRAGEYFFQMRDLTSRFGAPDFAYRILIRPSVPHLGHVGVVEDRVNLEIGQAETLTVNVNQQEGFQGDVSIHFENLPPGVRAIPAAEVEPDRGPPLPAVDTDRFVPKKQKVNIVLVAREDAPLNQTPHYIKITARPIVNGKAGDPLTIMDLPIMVIQPIEESTSEES